MVDADSSSSSFLLINMRRSYCVIIILIIVSYVYWLLPSSNISSKQVHADISRLSRSSLFIYTNISSQIHFSESQGLIFVPLSDYPAHFASIKSDAVRGNHRHTSTENSVSGEVIILLQGQFLFRIGDGDKNTYEDHRYDISKTGIVALKFTADKCHSLKNIGKETNWFASYYIKSKDTLVVPVDREGCKNIKLT